MTLQIQKPFIHVEDANGNPYVGAVLYVYMAGTTTLASIYSDDGLSVSLANPLSGSHASDAAGNFPRAYIAAGTYKLRAETSAGVLIWEFDNIDTGLPAGTGALPISRGGTGATTAAAARSNLDVPSNSELADLATDISDIQAAVQGIVSTPQGRLTLTSGTPQLSTGVTAGTAVYYTTYIGNTCPVYNGTQFIPTTFAELTLTLNSNHVANAHYDVFFAIDSAIAIIGTGPAWNTATAGAGARGAGAGTTELERFNGLWVNKYDITLRNGATTYTITARQATFLGSLSMDGTNGQISCLTVYGQSRKWGVSNAYNRLPTYLKAGDNTATSSYTTATMRASNGASANSLEIFSCLPEIICDLRFVQFTSGNQPNTVANGIGYNSTTTASGKSGKLANNAATNTYGNDMVAEYLTTPFIGKNTITSLEIGAAGSTTVWTGAETNMLLSARFMA